MHGGRGEAGLAYLAYAGCGTHFVSSPLSLQIAESSNGNTRLLFDRERAG